ncbi:polysaccharide pyruvyl transferase family protein [Butyrivibrio sp. XPD2002]|uniref:polysaccharide pyruvyl transferase family protein n=1 Tax=Butyrivibrio sp. XPD2002 TaxID=1280665 RepID=UPI001FA7B3DB|nr:polysaccharide pyruvyl transferase family protein [Butyrivibrio sp. XPD2002]
MSSLKKIGIITYHHYYNYGTMLQAFALQKLVESCGCSAELIDFQNDESLGLSEIILLRIRRVPVYLLQFKKYITLATSKQILSKRCEIMEEFYKAYIKTGGKQYSTNEDLISDPPLYDGYVVGSDQTWNPYVGNRPEPFYLTFVNDNKKKGSYAPSFPVSNITKEQEEFLREKLGSFAFLSCRERSGAEYLERILGRQVKNVLDPTLLVDKKDWEKYEKNEAGIAHPNYIFVYLLGENSRHRDIINHIKYITGYPVVAVPMTYREMLDNDWEKAIVGPSGFLYLIHHASLVCTDSFHATMFSVNYNKSFFAFRRMRDNEKASNNSRVYDSLAMFGLGNRLIGSEEEIPKTMNIDYSVTNSILTEKRADSFDYLRRMLMEITQ